MLTPTVVAGIRRGCAAVLGRALNDDEVEVADTSRTLTLAAVRPAVAGESVAMVLPLPPSVNAYWRSVPASRGRTARVLISGAGRRFKAACQLAAAAQCRKPMQGEVAVSGVVYFRDRRRDLDNVLKPLLDALQGSAYVNDSQIGAITLMRDYDARHPRVELTITRVTRETP
jgi:crossover junction endodeoxyribonuclease RusA